MSPKGQACALDPVLWDSKSQVLHPKIFKNPLKQRPEINLFLSAFGKKAKYFIGTLPYE